MWLCAICNTSNNADDDYCVGCGSPKLALPHDNHCSNPDCHAFKVILSNPEQKHCGKCGSSTTYWKMIKEYI